MLLQDCGFTKFPPQRYVIRASTICCLGPPRPPLESAAVSQAGFWQEQKVGCVCVCVCVCVHAGTDECADAYIWLCRFVWVESMTQSSRKCDGWVGGAWCQTCVPFADFWLSCLLWGHSWFSPTGSQIAPRPPNGLFSPILPPPWASQVA